MRVHILGCGDAFGSGGRLNTCFALTTGAGHRVMVDFGATSMPALRQQGLTPNDIDAVVLTHLHGDHFAGLPFLLLYLQFEAKRTRPLSLYGPPDTAARLEALTRAMFGCWPSWDYPLDIRTLAPDSPQTVAGLAVEAFPVIHGQTPAQALRVREGARVFAYSGDTRWTDVLPTVADGADLFVMECYAPEATCPTHTDWPALKAHLPDLNAKRLALTHLSQPMLDRRAEIDAHPGVEILAAGMTFDL